MITIVTTRAMHHPQHHPHHRHSQTHPNRRHSSVTLYTVSNFITLFIIVISTLCFVSNINGQAVTTDGDAEHGFEMSRYVKLESDFRPLYYGKVITRSGLNLSDSAKLFKPEMDYYEPGEGPEDDDDEMENAKEEMGNAAQWTPSSTTTTTTTTTSTTPSTTTTAAVPAKTQSPRPQGYLHADHVKLGPDFKPRYKGKVINRYDLNLTDAARIVDPKTDYYEPGEGPEDDEDDVLDENISEISESVQSSTAKSTTSSSSSSISPISVQMSSTTTTTTSTPLPSSSTTEKGKYFAISDHIKIGDDFKPLYAGKVMSRNDVNLSESATKINYGPDYYEPGEGPEDDDDEDDHAEATGEVGKGTVLSSSTTTTTTTTESSSSLDSISISSTSRSTKIASESDRADDDTKLFSIVELITVGPDFKPFYKGKVLSRNDVILSESAKKFHFEADYYEPGEGPIDDDDDDVEAGVVKSSTTSSTTTTFSTTTTTTTTTSAGLAASSESSDPFDDEPEPENIDLAVGGISGILQKIIQGPKASELNANSTPEQVYAHLSAIVSEESSKALKATIPRIYDYQYQIGELVSQRCFNSFAQFGDRMRQGYVWPMQMISSSSGMSVNMGLREYGDFDRCIDLIADDDERRPSEQFFTGQYCMMQLQLPLPELRNRNLSYSDKVLNFSETELGGSISDFVALNAPFLYSNPLSMGVCVPSTCLPYEIEDVVQFFLKKYHIKVHLGVDCYSKVNLTVTHLPGDLFDVQVRDLLREAQSWKTWARQFSTIQLYAIAFIFISAALVCASTAVECYRISRNPVRQWSSSERNRPKSFFACFSARYNLEQALLVRHRYRYEITNTMLGGTNCSSTVEQDSDRSSDDRTTAKDDLNNRSYVPTVDTGALDGLKGIALIWICLGNFFMLGYQPQMLPSVAHLREVMLDLQNSASFQMVTQSWLSMEIFFLISGFLFAYTALPYIARRDGRPNLLFFIAKRLHRFLPSIVFALLCVQLLPLWQNAGPLYKSGVKSMLEPCKHNFWPNLFFISNFYSYEQTCLPQFWYISVEFQLTLLGVFVTIFCFNRSQHACKAFLLLIVAGVAYSGNVTFVNRIDITAPIFKNAILMEIPKLAKSMFFSTPVHFTAYFIGCAIGYYARVSNIGHYPLPKPLRVMLWLTLPGLTLFTIYLQQHWPIKPRFKYARATIAFYFAAYRTLFIGTFAWILYECIHHRAGLLRSILSNTFFRFLSQLSFQIYLLNLSVVSIYFFTRRTVIYASTIDTLSIAIMLFALTVMLSAVTYLLFEAPYRSLFRYYFQSPRILSLLLPINGNGHHHHHNGHLDGALHHHAHHNGRKLTSDSTSITGSIRFSKRSMINLNPNFLFSPHYNMVTNVSSRAESENSSLADFSISSQIQPPPPTIYSMDSARTATPPPSPPQ